MSDSLRDDFDAIVQLSATPLLIEDRRGMGWDAHDNGPLSAYVQRNLSAAEEYDVALTHQVSSTGTDTAIFTPDDAETLGRRLIASAQAARSRKAAAEQS